MVNKVEITFDIEGQYRSGQAIVPWVVNIMHKDEDSIWSGGVSPTSELSIWDKIVLACKIS